MRKADSWAPNLSQPPALDLSAWVYNNHVARRMTLWQFSPTSRHNRSFLLITFLVPGLPTPPTGDLAILTDLVIGSSRGIGAAAALHLASKGAKILSVSRSPAPVGTWIKANIATSEGVERVIKAVGDRPLDGLLFLGGAWEKGAFTEDYSFLDSPTSETLQIIAVNLTAPILLAQGLAGNFATSNNGRIILMGSMSGVPNTATPEVANTAAKFGLQGAAEALNLSLRSHGIATTVINPDNVATPEIENDIAAGRFGEQVPIPMDDLNKTIEYVLSMSVHSVPVSISIRQTSVAPWKKVR